MYFIIPLQGLEVSRHGQTLHLVFHPPECSDWQVPTLFLWSLPMESVVQLLKNLQFWNPEQTEVGASYEDWLCAMGNLTDRLSNIKSATPSNEEEKSISQSKKSWDSIWMEFEVFSTYGWKEVCICSLHKIKELRRNLIKNVCNIFCWLFNLLRISTQAFFQSVYSSTCLQLVS